MKNNILYILLLGLIGLGAFLYFAKSNTSSFDYVLEARLAYAEGKVKTAKRYYLKAINHDKENILIKQEYLLFSVNTRNLTHSYNIAKQIVAKEKHITSSLVIVAHYIQNEQYKEAINLLEQIQNDTLSIQNILLDVLKSFQDSSYQSSVMKLLQYNEPEYYYYILSQIALNNGDKKLAIEYLNYLVTNNVNLDAILLQSKLLYDEDKQKGMDLFNFYLDDGFITEEQKESYIADYKQPSLKDIFAYTMAYFSNYVSDDVNEVYQSSDSFVFNNIAMMVNSNDSLSKFYVANFYEKVGNIDKAVAIYKQVSINNFYHLQARDKVIELYKYRSDYKSLVNYLNVEHSRRKNDINILLELANVYEKIGKRSKAIILYSRALDLSNKRNNALGVWLSYYFRGIANYKNNKVQEAEDDLLKAIEIDSSDALLNNYLAYIWIEQDKNIDEAVNLLEEVLKSNPTNYNILDSYAFGLFKQKNYTKALEMVELAMSIYPYDDVINEHFGDILWQNGYKKEAINRWDSSFNLSKDKKLRERVSNKSRGVLPDYLDPNVEGKDYDISNYLQLSN